MLRQKQKSLIHEFGWFFLVLLIIVAVSFTLGRIANYYNANAGTTVVRALDYSLSTTGSNLNSKNITQVSSLFKEGYVGAYFITVPGDKESDNFTRTLTASTPRVLGAKDVKEPYQAKLVSKSYQEINIAPSKRITFEAEFENTGTETWYNSGEHFIALNVTNPPGRESDLRDIFWPKDYRPCIMNTEEVKPGETGLFRFALTAPSKKEWYVEKFGLVAENLIWIDGGDLEIVMKVGNPKPHFRAELVDQSHEEITIEPGKAITVWADFKNTGSETWYQNSEHFVALNVTGPVGRKSAFRHDFWPLDYRPTVLKNESVAPNETGRFEFALQAPDTPDAYTEKFGLVAENLTWIVGGNLTMAVKVEVEPEPVTEIVGEPDIRVGLYSTVSVIKITGNGKYEVRNSNGKLLGTYNKNVVSTANYNENTGKYSLKVNNKTSYYNLPLRFTPIDDTILEITNYENRPAWNEELNDNRYRGILEVHYAESSDRLWVINELPLESYLRGIAEAGNDNNKDYLKALLVAARTYAMYHIQTNTKHDDENYTVDATFDQVYRGYGFEFRSPNITQAILDTEGEMVTYDGEIVVTPYFSQTDGRTRSWEEIWSGGPYAWLVSVSDPNCEGLELLGHGVGMSAYGARAMAEDGNSYKKILKHYYTGVDIEDVY